MGDNQLMPFALPDYDLACAYVISDVTKAIARASDPVLSQIKVVPMKGTVSSVVETRGEMALDLPAEPVGFELGVKAEDVRDGNFEALQVKLVEAADGYAAQLAKMLYGNLDKITTATGNTLTPEGVHPPSRWCTRCSTRSNGRWTRTTSCQHRLS